MVLGVLRVVLMVVWCDDGVDVVMLVLVVIVVVWWW